MRLLLHTVLLVCMAEGALMPHIKLIQCYIVCQISLFKEKWHPSIFVYCRWKWLEVFLIQPISLQGCFDAVRKLQLSRGESSKMPLGRNQIRSVLGCPGLWIQRDRGVWLDKRGLGFYHRAWPVLKDRGILSLLSHRRFVHAVPWFLFWNVCCWKIWAHQKTAVG